MFSKRLNDLKDKAKQITQDERLLSIKDKGEEVLEQSIANIQSLVKEQLGPRARDIIENDDLMEKALSRAYDIFIVTHPLIRLAVRRERFINFCLKNRNRLIEKYDSAKQIEGSEQCLDEGKMLLSGKERLKDTMKNRIIDILNLLSDLGYQSHMAGKRASPYVIKGFEEVAENTFMLEADVTPLMYLPIPDSPFANLKKREQQAIVRFYPPVPDDDVFTIEIRLVFGVLGTMGMNVDTVGRQLLAFLNKNIGTFAGSGAYIGIERVGNGMNASLNCMLHFLIEWDNNDITQILSFQLSTMYKALENNNDTSLTILKRVGDRADM